MVNPILTPHLHLSHKGGFISNVILRSVATKNPFSDKDNTDSSRSLPLRPRERILHFVQNDRAEGLRMT